MASEQTPKRQAISWQQVHRDAADLGGKLRDLAPGAGWRGIVAISVGGLVPAVLVARELDLKLIETVCVSSYHGEAKFDVEAKGELVVHKGAADTVADGGQDWLLVDDLVDTGATAEAVRNMLPNAHFATLYAKPFGRPYVDTYVADVDQDLWVDFPWDMPAGA